MAERSVRVRSSARRASVRAPKSASRTASLDAVLALSVVEQQTVLARGLPVAAIDRLKDLLGVSLDQLAAYVAIPARTLARRRGEGMLDPLESDRLLRIARIHAQALGLFDGEDDKAREWLSAPQRALGGRSPLQFASTEVGAREVEALIGRLAHGAFN